MGTEGFEMSKELMQMIGEQESRFLKLDEANGNILDFKQECLFAKQQISRNSTTLDTATNNMGSLQSAILNVAAVGISLNPALQHAFLVPRGGQICLDISFRGLTKIATDAGSIRWAKAELVYENDTFAYKGVNQPPELKADVFGERGKLKGGFCLAKLPDGDYLVDTMSVDEIHKVRDTSKAKKSGPWVSWYGEMCKKTIIKRAYKSWPQTENRLRLDKAVETINEHEGIAFTIEEQATLQKLIDMKDALGVYIFCETLPEGGYEAIYYSFPKGKKTAYQNSLRELSFEGHKFVLDKVIPELIDRIDASDAPGAFEVLDEFEESGKEVITKLLGGIDQDKLELLNIMRSESSE